MRTVHEVSRLTGVSIRTLQYYDKIGLLHPSAHTGSGYRLYDDTALEKLQQILLFRSLEFPLKEIRQILENPAFDRKKALDQQIALLTLKKQHIERLIILAREIKLTGGNYMDFSAFDTTQIEAYSKQAKETWGATAEYKEFEEKNCGRTPKESKDMGEQLMNIIAVFGELKDGEPQSAEAQTQVKKLQDFITANYYTCTNEILAQLGTMYAAGGAFTVNIDAAGGKGTAAFAQQSIECYCAGKETGK